MTSIAPCASTPPVPANWTEGVPTELGTYWAWGYQHASDDSCTLFMLTVVMIGHARAIMAGGTYKPNLGRIWYTPAILPDPSTLPPAQCSKDELKALHALDKAVYQRTVPEGKIAQQLKKKGLMTRGVFPQVTKKAKEMMNTKPSDARNSLRTKATRNPTTRASTIT